MMAYGINYTHDPYTNLFAKQCLSLVSANSGGLLQGLGWRGGGRSAPSVAGNACGEVGGGGGFLANPCREREGVRKRGAHEQAAEAAGGRLRRAVPEAGGNRGGGRGDVAQDGPGGEAEFG